jgi:predicted membrane protein
VGARINAFALFGGVEIDLTEALFERRELVVNATAIFGGVEIRVPENVTLRGSGTGIMGGYDVESAESADPDAPVVVVRGAAVFGGVEARAKRGKRLRDLRR